MAVDSNVIIFSRIREEMSLGKTVRVSVQSGFKRAIGTIIDSQVTTIIAAVILVSTWHLLSESVRMSMDAVPEHIDPDDIKQMMEATPGVRSIHHLHIWPISTTETALTAHLVVSEQADAESIVHRVKHLLREHGIGHATLETEQEGHSCADEPDGSC